MTDEKGVPRSAVQSREAIALLFSDEIRRRAGCIGTTPVRALDTVSQNGAYRFADAVLVAIGAAQAPRVPTRSDIGVIIRDSMSKDEGWLQYLPAADAILNYWAILNKNTSPTRGVNELARDFMRQEKEEAVSPVPSADREGK